MAALACMVGCDVVKDAPVRDSLLDCTGGVGSSAGYA